jgi:alkanesulfonate monooxygenase SsuD/methylene tetrahydromethanopterin reductase-like flavin-dependent oxidoreductase (luciferase family)
VTRPLRVGIQLPEAERRVPWPEYVRVARTAESVGFDSIWMGDHLLYRDPREPERGPWDAWTLMAGLATVTSRVRLGPLVACTAFRNPAVLAKTAATLAEIAGGRLVVGLGAGWNEPEFRAFGLPWDHRATRFAESFRIVHALLAGDRVSFDGRFERTEDAVLLPPLSHPIPLMVGSTGDRVLAATLPLADAWNVWGPWYGNDAAGFAEQNRRVEAIAESLGREPSEIERSVCVFTSLPLEAGEEAIDEGVPPLAGTPLEIARGLQMFAEAGADEVILVPSPSTERAFRALGEVLAILDGAA